MRAALFINKKIVQTMFFTVFPENPEITNIVSI